jgi:hypothetical protein
VSVLRRLAEINADIASVQTPNNIHRSSPKKHELTVKNHKYTRKHAPLVRNSNKNYIRELNCQRLQRLS